MTLPYITIMSNFSDRTVREDQ